MYPALAVADALRAGADDDVAIALTYIGSVDGMEAELVARESDLPFRSVHAAPLRGRARGALVGGLLTLLRGIADAWRLIGRERPDAILGTGGYVCVPIMLAARLRGVRTALYLPDVVPGLAVRLLSRIVTITICTSEATKPHLWGVRLRVTGYPVRRAFGASDKQTAREACTLRQDWPVVFVYGGSRGARSINHAIAEILEPLLELTQVIHLCGREGDEAMLQRAAAELPEWLRERYRLYPYLHAERTDDAPSLFDAFASADLVISRSGASVLGELPAAGVPAILIPYPHVHQEENADALVAAGAALKIADHDLAVTGDALEGPLYRALYRLITDWMVRGTMEARMAEQHRPDAAAAIARIVRGLALRERVHAL